MVVVEILGRIQISFDGQNIKAIGDLILKNSIDDVCKAYGPHPKKWPDDLTTLKKVLRDPKWSLSLLRFTKLIKGTWKMPYEHDELCHCRMVPTVKVIAAIEQGSRSTQDIARTTQAGTGCGTCRSDSDAILDYYAA